jgi:GNAT superfamily N-acetyltransferase
MSRLFQKTLDRLRSDGPKETLKAALAGARRTALDLDRVVLVLRVDLMDPKNHLRPRDREKEVPRLLPFDRTTLPRVLEVASRHEPWRVKSVRQRYMEGMSGFVAEHKGEIVGYVFWTEGTDHPERLVHSDLHWLQIRPRRREIYAFDYFLIEPARGLGAAFARAVQEEHFRMGYTAAYGCVFQTNRAALWLYRTTGWTEVGRVTEHRILSRIAVVGRTVYWMNPFSRTPIGEIPEGLGRGP